MAPTITTSNDLIAHFNGYVSIIGSATTTAADLAPYIAPTLQLNGKTITVEEFRTLIPPNTEVIAEKLVADVEQKAIAARVRAYVPATGMKLTEHVFYELDSEWRVNKVTRLYEMDGNEIPNGN
ncbi:hypothetical protein K438DRAFT_2024952 [Mycena galopus ATCC 62051]|nr:hypothetical protein K438DRAFT_2024952 [Mycena galopus ATCC 62051]